MGVNLKRKFVWTLPYFVWMILIWRFGDGRRHSGNDESALLSAHSSPGNNRFNPTMQYSNSSGNSGRLSSLSDVMSVRLSREGFRELRISFQGLAVLETSRLRSTASLRRRSPISSSSPTPSSPRETIEGALGSWTLSEQSLRQDVYEKSTALRSSTAEPGGEDSGPPQRARQGRQEEEEEVVRLLQVSNGQELVQIVLVGEVGELLRQMRECRVSQDRDVLQTFLQQHALGAPQSPAQGDVQAAYDQILRHRVPASAFRRGVVQVNIGLQVSRSAYRGVLVSLTDQLSLGRFARYLSLHAQISQCQKFQEAFREQIGATEEAGQQTTAAHAHTMLSLNRNMPQSSADPRTNEVRPNVGLTEGYDTNREVKEPEEEASLTKSDNLRPARLSILRDVESELLTSLSLDAVSSSGSDVSRSKRSSIDVIPTDLETKRSDQIAASTRGEESLSRQRRDLLSGWFIYPGTKWCGDGDIAEHEDDLGYDEALDTCCQTHDRCRHVIPRLSWRYGLLNIRLHTMSHCKCDRLFRRCLEKSTSPDADFVGKIYFNIIEPQCFKLRKTRVCRRRNWWGQCKRYGVTKVAHAQRQRAFRKRPLR